MGGLVYKKEGGKKGKKRGKKGKKKKRFCRTKKSYCCFWTVLVKGSGYEAKTTSCSATTSSDPEGILSAGYCIPFDGLSFELAILHGSFFLIELYFVPPMRRKILSLMGHFYLTPDPFCSNVWKVIKCTCAHKCFCLGSNSE